jgi:hypothetical protein
MDTFFRHDIDVATPPGSQDDLHRRLAYLNQRRFLPAFQTEDWEQQTIVTMELLREENFFLEGLRAEVSRRAANAPLEAQAFVSWFEKLAETGPGQKDFLFPWLADKAEREDMRWFLTQEVAGEAGFDDLVALTQVKLPQQAKLELARNYWDEMGRGRAKGMHGPMLETLARAFGLRPTVEETVWEALALANTMSGLAANRRYAFHAVGALGVIELTAPGRARSVAAGLMRLGVPAADRHYFDLHGILDVKHSAAWNREAIAPLVEAVPDAAVAIAEGALMRLTCGARCFARYRNELGVLESDEPCK